jgi:ketosteroid isomerase-like protein
LPEKPGRTGEIRATLKQMVADPALPLKFTAAKIDVARSGDLGYTRGAYVLTMTDP